MSYSLAKLKALADETRLNILLLLLKSELPVQEIVDHIKKSQPNISIALKKMEHAGLIISRKEGKNVYYSIENKTTIQKILELVKDE